VDRDVADRQRGSWPEPQNIEGEHRFGAFHTRTPTVFVIVVERLAVGLERAQTDLSGAAVQAQIERPGVDERE